MCDKLDQIRQRLLQGGLPSIPPGGVPAIGLPPGMTHLQAPTPPEDMVRNVRDQIAKVLFFKAAERLASGERESDLRTKEVPEVFQETPDVVRPATRVLAQRCFEIADEWTRVAQLWWHEAPAWVHPKSLEPEGEKKP